MYYRRIPKARILLLIVEVLISFYALYFILNTAEGAWLWVSTLILVFIFVRRLQINIYKIYRPQQSNSRPSLSLSNLNTYRFLKTAATSFISYKVKKKRLRSLIKKKSAVRDFANLFIDMTAAVFGAFVISLVLKFFFIDIYRVELNSMYPNLVPEQKVVVEKFTMGMLTPFFADSTIKVIDDLDDSMLEAINAKMPQLGTKALRYNDDQPLSIPYYRRLPIVLREIHRGDILVFLAPKRSDNALYVKRVIALPGDKMEFTEQGEIILNGKLLQEEYLPDNMPSLPVSSLFQIFPGSIRPKNKRSQFVIPRDHIYVMGDNRSSSQDSRNWGPIPTENIVGRVIYKIPK